MCKCGTALAAQEAALTAGTEHSHAGNPSSGMDCCLLGYAAIDLQLQS